MLKIDVILHSMLSL